MFLIVGVIVGVIAASGGFGVPAAWGAGVLAFKLGVTLSAALAAPSLWSLLQTTLEGKPQKGAGRKAWALYTAKLAFFGAAAMPLMLFIFYAAAPAAVAASAMSEALAIGIASKGLSVIGTAIGLQFAAGLISAGCKGIASKLADTKNWFLNTALHGFLTSF